MLLILRKLLLTVRGSRCPKWDVTVPPGGFPPCVVMTHRSSSSRRGLQFPCRVGAVPVILRRGFPSAAVDTQHAPAWLPRALPWLLLQWERAGCVTVVTAPQWLMLNRVPQLERAAPSLREECPSVPQRSVVSAGVWLWWGQGFCMAGCTVHAASCRHQRSRDGMGDLRWTVGRVGSAWLRDAFPGEKVLGITGFTQHPPEPGTEPSACTPLHAAAQDRSSRRWSDPRPDRCGAAWSALTLLRSLARLGDTLPRGEGPCEGMGWMRRVPSSPGVGSAIPMGVAVPPCIGCPRDHCPAPQSSLRAAGPQTSGR